MSGWCCYPGSACREICSDSMWKTLAEFSEGWGGLRGFLVPAGTGNRCCRGPGSPVPGAPSSARRLRPGCGEQEEPSGVRFLPLSCPCPAPAPAPALPLPLLLPLGHCCSWGKNGPKVSGQFLQEHSLLPAPSSAYRSSRRAPLNQLILKCRTVCVVLH